MQYYTYIRPTGHRGWESVAHYNKRRFCSNECAHQYAAKLISETKGKIPIIPIVSIPEEAEGWKNIDGFVGLYQVSRGGLVRSLDRKTWNGRGYTLQKGRILKPNVLKKGYLQVQLQNNQTKKCLQVHRIVASSFIPNPANYPQVNHINGNKQDNRVENLEWCTNSMNAIHAYRTGFNRYHGDVWRNRTKAKIKVQKFTMDGEFVAEYDSISEALRSIGVNTRGSTLYSILKSGREIYKGYRFRYV